MCDPCTPPPPTRASGRPPPGPRRAPPPPAAGAPRPHAPQPPAVHRHEGTVCPAPPLMKGASKLFLADTGLAEQQHWHIRLRQHFGLLQGLSQERTAPDDLAAATRVDAGAPGRHARLAPAPD